MMFTFGDKYHNTLPYYSVNEAFGWNALIPILLYLRQCQSAIYLYISITKLYIFSYHTSKFILIYLIWWQIHVKENEYTQICF